MSWTFPGTLEAVGETAILIRETLSQLALGDELVYAVELCFEELAVNIVRHGRGKPQPLSLASGAAKPEIELEAWLENRPDRLMLILRDNAAPFDVGSAAPRKIGRPLSDVTPGGLGLHLVNSFSACLRHERTAAGNQVTVEFAK
jgi:anti-sigma regulatory factor (Ser/Thr protein kinase)